MYSTLLTIPLFLSEATTGMPKEAHSHETFALGALFFVSVISIQLFNDYMIKKYKFFYLPESAAAILFGSIIGLFVSWFGNKQAEEALVFVPELFFFLLLPPIIFEAGYTLNQGNFFKNFGTILLYAVAGTLLSTFIVGYGLYFLAVRDLVPLSKDNALEALMFGSLISATDPVATLSLMGNPIVGAPPLLYALVFGEAVLNDAVAIVLYRTFEAFLDIPFTPTTVGQAVGTFVYVSIGSTLIGIGVALVCCFGFKQTDFRTMPQFEITLTLLFAFGSYFLSEIAHMSGIMALFFCGVVLAHYNNANISEVSRHVTHDAFKSLAQICETFVFIYLGITVGLSVAGENSKIKWDATLAFSTIFLCLFARLLNTFPLTWLANRYRLHKIPMNMQYCLWFSGLRGAIAFALALQVTTPNATVIMTSTLVVVLITTFIFGGLTERFLSYTGVKNAPADPHAVKPKRDRSPAHIAMKAALRKAQMTQFERFWLSFDNMYMKYWFGGVIQEEYSIYREPIDSDGTVDNLHDVMEVDTDTDEEEGIAINEALKSKSHFYAPGAIPENVKATFNKELQEDVGAAAGTVEAYSFAAASQSSH